MVQIHALLRIYFILFCQIFTKIGTLANTVGNEICSQEKDIGTGGGWFTKWFYNTVTGSCESFTYQGNGGNDNQFGSEEECRAACVSVATTTVTSLPAVQCGGNFTDLEGTLVFPRPAASCTYNITVPIDNVVQLNFSNQKGWNEVDNYRFEIYDGVGPNKLVLDTVIFMPGSRKSFRSNSSAMTVIFSRKSSSVEEIEASYSSIYAAPNVSISKTTEFRSGDTVILECSVVSPFEIQIKSVEWERKYNDCIVYPIDTGSSQTKYNGSTERNPSLTIYNITEADNGVYRCHAENLAGAGVSSPVNVSVQTPKPPKIVISQKTKQVTYGYSTQLQCFVFSNSPIVSVEWRKQEGDGTKSINVGIENRPNQSKIFVNSTLNIEKADGDSIGNYSCAARNEYGDAVSSAIEVTVIDFNECQNKTLHSCPQICESTFESYVCKCWNGYVGDGRRCSVDFNEIGKSLKSVVIPVTLQSIGWNSSLEDEQSEYYQYIDRTVISMANPALEDKDGFREARVLALSKGSVVVHLGIIVDKSSNLTTFVSYLKNTETYWTNRSVSFGNVIEGEGFISSVNISNKSLVAYEGRDITIQCIVKAVSLSDSVKFTWRLDNAEIKPTRSSRIQIQYKKIGPMTYTSNLTIRNAVSGTDEGNYSCAARLRVDDVEKLNDLARVEIYRFELKTNATVVSSSSSVSVNCTILPYRNNFHETLQMCKNGRIVKASSVINNSAVLNVNNLVTDVVVSCGWKKTNDCNKHKSVRISVVQPEYIRCNKSASNNITWEETFPGHKDYQECPSGFQGQASRFCSNVNFKGEWAEPSFINCTRKRIAEVTKKLNRIKDGVEVESLVTVLREFTNESNEISINNETKASDLKSSVEILEKVSEIVSNRDGDITQEETEEFILATDAILSTNNGESWNDLNNEIEDNSAAKVMDVVSDISRTALKTLDKTVEVNGENIVLKIEKKNISDITFPDTNTTSESQDIASRIYFSKETIKDSLNVTDDIKYSAAYYKTLGSFLDRRHKNQDIGSQIVAFSVPEENLIKMKKLVPPVKMYFKTVIETNFTHRQCAFWDMKLPNGGSWSTDGCTSYFSNESFTECHCDHLTNFAVLISIKEVAEDHHDVLSLITSIGCIISITCLVLTVVIYSVQWRHHSSDKAVILMLLCITLIIAYVVFLAGINRTENKDVCTGIALLLHFLFLSVLFLMVAEGVIHAIMVVAVFPSRQSVNKYLIPMSYGIPVVIVVLSASITQLEGYGTKKFCWLSIDNGLIYAFFVPCAFGVLVNITITCLLLKKLFSTRATMNKTTKEKIKTGVRSVMILAPLFGLTWLFGLFSFHEDAVFFAYVFVILNSLQGLLIFIMHAAMNKTVKKELNRRMSNLRREKEISTTFKSESSNTWNIVKKMKRKMSSPDTKTTADGSSSAMFTSTTNNPTYACSDDVTSEVNNSTN